MPRLLVVHHTPSPALQEMFEAVVSGARTDEIEGVEVVVRPATAVRLVRARRLRYRRCRARRGVDRHRPAVAQGPAAGLRHRGSQQAGSRVLLGAWRVAGGGDRRLVGDGEGVTSTRDTVLAMQDRR